MSATLALIRELVGRERVRSTAHAYVELEADGILYAEVLAGVDLAVVVEDYPDALRGPCVLTLQQDISHRPIHVVWGLRREHPDEAVLVTVYRPGSARWTLDFTKRK